MFIRNNQIDIMLMSETHFTKKYYFKTPSYLIYHTTHGKAHGGTSIIKINIRHHEIDNFKSEFLQNIIVEIENWSDSIVSSVYCPPKHIIVSEQFEAFFARRSSHSCW
jgi:hypothetical protein